jgi:dTDP-4-dehydrorhamnose reductase
LKILVTGSEGQLGSDLLKILPERHEVLGCDIQDWDITDLRIALENVERIRPDVIVNAAAYTDVDGCELNPDLAYRVNTLGAHNLAIAGRKVGAVMVHVSTDFVFDGKKGSPYLEFDPPHPLSVYGKSKLASEQWVAAVLSTYFIVRTAWLYGRRGKNFVKTILRLAEEKEVLRVVDDQIGSPTYSWDLAQKIAELIETEAYGIYHATNGGQSSWYEFASDILRLAGKKVKLEPISSEELARPAARPAFSVLRNYCLEQRGFSALRDYHEALEEFFSKPLE